MDGPVRTSSPLPTNRPEHHQNGAPPVNRAFTIPVNPVYLPGGPRSISGISIRGFGLGIAFGACVTLTAELAFLDVYLWRAPFFIAILSLFHYLEFDMTARYNPSDAKVSSYLLTSNGYAYNLAHTLAMTELFLRSWIRSSSRIELFNIPFDFTSVLPTVPSQAVVTIGLVLIVGGQYLRSAAMATAGNSFNHLVQYTKKDDHILVTHGVYAISRHPSYLGFFWWGIGTQVVLGNPFCLLGYAVVLWNFFASRIRSEMPV